MTTQKSALTALFDSAKDVRNKAHAPYSDFHVGAAVLDDRGQVHVGCNVENAAYPEGLCAEATAIGAMVSHGGRKITHIAIVGGPKGQPLTSCTPCGGCRQKILEFADSDTQIHLEDGSGSQKTYRINDLLPLSFRLKETHDS